MLVLDCSLHTAREQENGHSVGNATESNEDEDHGTRFVLNK